MELQNGLLAAGVVAVALWRGEGRERKTSDFNLDAPVQEMLMRRRRNTKNKQHWEMKVAICGIPLFNLFCKFSVVSAHCCSVTLFFVSQIGRHPADCHVPFLFIHNKPPILQDDINIHTDVS